jgi:hypothetical protein
MGKITMEKQLDLFARGGLEDEGGEVDEVSGNEVPVGGTKKGVRDDIPAMISEGEFIFPEDVVRYIGLDKLMQLRQEAKMGLKKLVHLILLLHNSLFKQQLIYHLLQVCLMKQLLVLLDPIQQQKKQ